MRIDLLRSADVLSVTALLRKIDRSLFDGLPLDPCALGVELAAARRDRYWGIWDGVDLQAAFFLRGLDTGYVAPAFGIAVAPVAQRSGYGQLALSFAEIWSRRAGLDEIMLTVSAANKPAIALYEKLGFVCTGERSAKGNYIYRKSLSK